MLTSDQEKSEEHQSSGLRYRAAHSRSTIAASSATSKPLTPTSIAWEDQQPQYARSANTTDYGVTVSLLFLMTEKR